MAHVFISYSRKDHEFARRLASDLTRSNLNVWIDEDDIPGGSNWPNAIQQGLEACEVMILVVSADSMASGNVEDEWQYFLDQRRPVIPVLVDSTQITHYQLRRLQRIDFYSQSYDQGLHQLMMALNKTSVGNALSMPSNPPSTTGRAMSVKKRPYLTVGVTIVAVIIIGILGLIGFMLIDGDNVKSNDDKEQSKTQAALALADHSTTQPPEPTTLPTSDPLQVAQTPVSENTSWEVAVQEFDGAKMVLVPVGCLMMGSENGDDDEKPVHHVCFEAPFWIDMTEVTNAQFAAFDGQAANESYFPGEERPREQITWAEAAAYCEHRGGRLPTEAEWEYAARGPDNWLYPWGDRWDPYKVVWSGNSDSQTVDVGSKPEGASWVGALDMSGNVGEWVTDWYDPDYYGLLADDAINPTGPESGANRVVRGGSWFGAGEDDFRASFRFDANPRGWDYYIGFRCARSG